MNKRTDGQLDRPRKVAHDEGNKPHDHPQALTDSTGEGVGLGGVLHRYHNNGLPIRQGRKAETMTKYNRIARNHYADYLKATATDLWQVYGRYSTAKINALWRCRQLCADLGGWGVRILSANSQAFTVGFEYPDKETGDICFAYITKDHDRYTTL